jgi:hypothetical protein
MSWNPQQTYSGDDGIEFDVGRLSAFAIENLTARELLVSELLHNLIGPDALSADEALWSRDFRRRSKRAHLKYPLLLTRDSDGRLGIIDGAHRLAKAILKSHESVTAYIFETIPRV